MEKIEVNFESVQDFIRAISKFQTSLIETNRQMKFYTDELGKTMSQCSRFRDVCLEIDRTQRIIDEDWNLLSKIKNDISSRLEFLQNFENNNQFYDISSNRKGVEEI